VSNTLLLLQIMILWVQLGWTSRWDRKLQFSDRHIAHFRQNSDRHLQISNRENYGCSKFQFCPKISKKKCFFWPQILHF